MILRDYQVVARDFLQDNPRAGLFLDMGLGKTACVLSALTPEHLPALVIAPKRVAENVWPAEHLLWRPDLCLEVAAGPQTLRIGALTSSAADVVVLGRDNCKDLLTARRRFRTIILDELSSFKGRGSWWKTLKRFTKTADAVWGLTGTPTPNGYHDLWAQLFLLDNGQRLGRTLGSFREAYFQVGRKPNGSPAILPNGVVYKWDLRPGADATIRERISDICLSMSTEGRVHLPPVTYNDIDVELPEPTKVIYRRMADQLLTEIETIYGPEVITARHAGALSNRLSQIAAGFLYPDADEQVGNFRYNRLHEEKTRAVQEVVEGTGGPVLVFYRYRAEAAELQAVFGSGARTINEPGVIDAWNRKEVPVLLAHPASAGHGLNLQHGGHTIVWTSPTWDDEHWEQGNKRLLRSGQTDPVVIHTVMGNGTVDHLVARRLDGKVDLQAAFLAHLEAPL